jgi:crossover junction endodeoxyribonuclease RuvC
VTRDGVTRVLGLDPGTRRFGWGVIAREGTRGRHVAHGVISLGDGPLAERLVVLRLALLAIIDAHGPQAAGVEGMFFHRDAQAAAKLGHARGIALLVCGERSMPVFEYAPARVKRTVAAYGRADKAQVGAMVRALLGLAVIPASDASDALAIALTHLAGAASLTERVPSAVAAALTAAKRRVRKNDVASFLLQNRAKAGTKPSKSR